MMTEPPAQPEGSLPPGSPTADPAAGEPGPAFPERLTVEDARAEIDEALGRGEPGSIQTQNERLGDGINRCPRCGSTEIQLRPATGMLVCLFCRHEWSEADIESVVAAPDDDLWELKGTVVASGAADIDPSVSGVLTMKCSGCGSEVVVNTEQAMTSRCHWCRHILTVNEQVANGAVPDAVLPFGLTHTKAIENIRAFAGKRRLFAHKRFKKEFRPENVVGVYLPYMIIDANASTDVWGKGEILIRQYTRGNDNNKTTYYDADVYQIERHIDFIVDDLTVESSSERANMDRFVNTNNVINTILPFDTKNAVKWNASYLTGFTSEKRDQDVAGVQPLLENQLLSIARHRIEPSVRNFNRGVRWEQERLEVHGTRWVSMYLPVWLYSYYHEERGKAMVHYIAVNGRTGETMGSVPVSRAKLLFAALTLGTFVEGLAIAILAVMA